MKKNRLLIVLVSIAVLLSLAVGTVAVTVFRSDSVSGTFERKTINRVNIKVENTEFKFKKADENGRLQCSVRVYIEKTERDFYGKIDSIVVKGDGVSSVIYTAGKYNGDAKLPENVLITAYESENKPMWWDIDFTVPYEKDKTDYNVSIDINYTSGVKPTVTDSFITSVPVEITFKD